MSLEPTHVRNFQDGTPASVLSVQPGDREAQLYLSQGFELCPVWDHGEHIDTVPLDGMESGPYGYVWVGPDGGCA